MHAHGKKNIKTYPFFYIFGDIFVGGVKFMFMEAKF